MEHDSFLLANDFRFKVELSQLPVSLKVAVLGDLTKASDHTHVAFSLLEM